MKRWQIISILALLTLGGCSETTKESIQSDTEKGAESASKQAKDVMEPISDAASTAAAATTLTPRLKLAITADSELNDSRNLINVNSNKDTVTLDGHVTSEVLKAKAEGIVRAEMAKANASQGLVNNLTIKTGG
jgi:osmotically-inducible protein OsmY